MKDILDEVTKLQTLTEFYKSKAVTEFQKSLVTAMEQITAKLLNFPSEFSRQQLNALKREIALTIKEIHEPLVDNLLDDNNVIVTMAYEVYAGALVDDFRAIPKTSIEKILDPNRHILGQTLKEISTSLTDKQTDYYKKVIANGMINGDSVPTMAKTLRDYNDGTLRNHINAIVRTSFQSAMQEAFYEAMRQMDSDVKLTYAFSYGVLDSRTSVICQEQTGKVVKRRVGESYTSFYNRALAKLIRTPRHVNCRSKILFETSEGYKNRLKEDRPSIVDSDVKTVKHRDGTKSTVHKNKEVEFYSQDITYDEWFMQQSPKLQKQVLGAKKYELFKKGDFHVSSLRDLSNNTWLTNEEIMALM